jgi:chorismate mutase/prephenate dehydratase
VDDPLKQLRARIDTLDDELLKLLSERARIAQEVGRTKNGEKIYRAEREAQIVRRLTDANPGPLGGESIERLFREIMSACRALEQAIRVAYLGPAGTFSQAAVFKQFGHEITALPETDIDACFRSVETGRADFAVVPVENSTEGVISRTLDLIVTSPLQICGEVMLPIHQNLMRAVPSPLRGEGQGGGDMRGEGVNAELEAVQASVSPPPQPSPLKGEGANAWPNPINRVYGHAQSLAQCQQWLNRHLPHAQRISVVSNSEGAQRAATEPDAATLGSETAAELYGLNIVETRVEDEAGNTTRFLVLAPHDAAPSGCDKTSFVMGAHNQPGAIVKLLQPLADAGISMSKLESRPVRSANWEYLFFVVCEGHREEARLSATLAEIEKRAAFLKILGSYPVSAG